MADKKADRYRDFSHAHISKTSLKMYKMTSKTKANR